MTTDIIFSGIVSISSNDRDAFIEDFYKLLESKKAIFKGSITANEYEEAEIVD